MCGMVAHGRVGSRAGVALALATGIAQGAARALRPRDGIIPAAPVAVAEHFSAKEVARARAFRRPQRLLGLVAGAAGMVAFAGPVVLDPLFNDFRPLPDGDVRRDVLGLAERAGVRVGEVYVVDASRRTTAANAYVTGLGATKRVVLFDTLLES